MMKANRTIYFTALVLVIGLVCGCSSVAIRNPLPYDFEDMAQIPGLDVNARMWGDEPPPYMEEWYAQTREQLEAEFEGIMGREHNYLAISGGGANGAFGAGVLAGWTASGTRPEFTIVTGISTGALTAPFAFLGPAYDAQLKEVYTEYSTKDLIKQRNILAAITGDSAVSVEPLKAVLAKYINRQMIDAIAAEGKKGRILFVGTTELDSDRPIIWSITDIALSGHPEAMELIHKVLIASASIPVAFPPVIFEVEANGRRYDEIHADGGTSPKYFSIQ